MKILNIYLKISLLFSVVAVFMFIYSCAINPVTGKKQLVLMSEEQEIEMEKTINWLYSTTWNLPTNYNPVN